MRSKQIFIFIACLGWIMSGCLGTGTLEAASTPTISDQVSAVTFKTPEEAITYYFEGMAQGDIHKILQACAVEEMSEKFNFDLYSEMLGGVILPAQSLSPSDYPLYIETNKLQLSSQISNRVKIFAYSLLSSEEVADGSMLTELDAERIAKFMNDVDPARLSGLKVEKIELVGNKIMKEVKYLEHADKIAHVYGADESTERIALFLFEQNYYYLGFTLLRYGENWKINSQTSALANTNPLGAPQKITVEEFESITNE